MPTWEKSGRMVTPAWPHQLQCRDSWPTVANHTTVANRPVVTACLGEERQDGHAGVAAHHRHVHLGHIKACLLGEEGLGAHLHSRGSKSGAEPWVETGERSVGSQWRDAAMWQDSAPAYGAAPTQNGPEPHNMQRTQHSMRPQRSTAHAPRPGWSHPARASRRTRLQRKDNRAAEWFARVAVLHCPAADQAPALTGNP